MYDNTLKCSPCPCAYHNLQPYDYTFKCVCLVYIHILVHILIKQYSTHVYTIVHLGGVFGVAVTNQLVPLEQRCGRRTIFACLLMLVLLPAYAKLLCFEGTQ
ncbi:hypothetical protein H5410_002723 [Solanum commersonii]|uniref:Uncharacterized protein n=1 Tax=Solanum commersonii TaxID=4109 RepID=A0A9J6B2R4_SOLCO|nr:hypothetical protein H5410_002723 [Solanum commersonii]